MGTHSRTKPAKIPTPKSPSTTGGFGRKLLTLVVVAVVIAVGVVKLLG